MAGRGGWSIRGTKALTMTVSEEDEGNPHTPAEPGPRVSPQDVGLRYLDGHMAVKGVDRLRAGKLGPHLSHGTHFRPISISGGVSGGGWKGRSAELPVAAEALNEGRKWNRSFVVYIPQSSFQKKGKKRQIENEEEPQCSGL